MDDCDLVAMTASKQWDLWDCRIQKYCSLSNIWYLIAIFISIGRSQNYIVQRSSKTKSEVHIWNSWKIGLSCGIRCYQIAILQNWGNRIVIPVALLGIHSAQCQSPCCTVFFCVPASPSLSHNNSPLAHFCQSQRAGPLIVLSGAA